MKIAKISVLTLATMFSGLLFAEESSQPEMTVYRSPTCGCCGKWLEHAENSGFKIKDVISSDMDQIKARYGVPEKLASCHTVVVDGYVIEGHVPAADVQKLLKEKPAVAGLAVPGMPMGSPGMEMGGRQDDYKVVSFDKDGHYAVYAEHGNGR
ncbi:DUF411 domain-containing protein [Methylomonas sp. UP202]|uniref:DUF411 domain-containing protein n=1 Tax=Methylomonas sp. UP202 TaxID=3040943 RepID=UPI002479B2DE|nr:DUF411 domain-containing protein [Methylomonas sp. UP202]WGS86781.1 DUF411 domain-containing protein [Methylomonas sp. UP202]